MNSTPILVTRRSSSLLVLALVAAGLSAYLWMATWKDLNDQSAPSAGATASIAGAYLVAAVRLIELRNFRRAAFSWVLALDCVLLISGYVYYSSRVLGALYSTLASHSATTMVIGVLGGAIVFSPLVVLVSYQFIIRRDRNQVASMPNPARVGAVTTGLACVLTYESMFSIQQLHLAFSRDLAWPTTDVWLAFQLLELRHLLIIVLTAGMFVMIICRLRATRSALMTGFGAAFIIDIALIIALVKATYDPGALDPILRQALQQTAVLHGMFHMLPVAVSLLVCGRSKYLSAYPAIPTTGDIGVPEDPLD